MKNLIVLIAFLTIFNSCSKDNVAMDNTGYYGKWTLVAMSGSIPNSEVTGAAMEWQEFYLFNTNGNFYKIQRKKWGKNNTFWNLHNYHSIRRNIF